MCNYRPRPQPWHQPVDTRHMWCVQKVPEICLNNIFLYLELAEYYPLQNSPCAHQFTSPAVFSTFGSIIQKTFVVSPSSHSYFPWFVLLYYIFVYVIYCRNVLLSVSCVTSSAAAQVNNVDEATLWILSTDILKPNNARRTVFYLEWVLHFIT